MMMCSVRLSTRLLFLAGATRAYLWQQAIRRNRGIGCYRKIQRNVVTTSEDVSARVSAAEYPSDSRAYVSAAVMESLEALYPGVAAAPMVTSATKFEFGDYQCNAALALAKKVEMKPREVGEAIRKELISRLGDSVDAELAGPGFINLRLSDAYLSEVVKCAAGDEERAGADIVQEAEQVRVVVDYSSPNIAKEMHVGHLRSTVIGDCLANVLEFRGREVIRQNHVGDWGTQFGMLLAYLEESEDATTNFAVSNLVEVYRSSKQRFDADDSFKETARKRVVDLQAGDTKARHMWEAICEASRLEFDQVYQRLGVSPELEERGESAYNPMLENIVQDLEAQGMAVESEGATVVFDQDQDKAPLIVRKSDGGFNYATTDLAAAAYRSRELNASRVLYVTDAGQSAHFRQVFDVARRAHIVPSSMSLEHVPFGLVQGEDGKKFKTRSGDTVKLKELLDEAVLRASADLEQRSSDSDLDPKELAAAIGIAAVKYADLKINRESNYRFSFEKMLALTGNTAPYMLYSYARISGIKRQCADDGLFDAFANDRGAPLVVDKEEDRNLARVLARFSPTLADLDADLRPNVLCEYLYELSQTFNRFYEACPVRRAQTPELAASRASLCAATANTLRLGLRLLGIPVLERL